MEERETKRMGRLSKERKRELKRQYKEMQAGKEKEKSGSLLLKVLWFIVFVITIGMAWIATSSVYYSIESKGWPTVPGVVLNSDIEYDPPDASSSSSKGTYTVKIEYRYIVNEEMYIGKRPQFGMVSSQNQSRAAELVGRYPKGKTVQVYYDPDKASRSVLEPGFRIGTLFCYIFAVVFGVLTIAPIIEKVINRRRSLGHQDQQIKD